MGTFASPEFFNDLLAYAQTLGLEEVDVDETIYELTNSGVAAEHATKEEAENPYGCLHDSADERAARINNEGLKAQVTAMFCAWGAEATRATLDEIALRMG